IRGAGDGSVADTIYFGGGTPSLLAPDEVGRLIAACRDSFAVTPDAEVTLELNPETATAGYLAAIRAARATRLSIGVPSFADDDAAEMYLRGLDLLDRAGYQHYEISNVARPGHQSRHNVKYWADGEWLAFGCGAHATRGGRRWHNVAGTADYVSRIATGQSVVAGVRTLSPQTRAEEALFTGI